MAKGKTQKDSPNDSGLNFEAQLWAAEEQAVPAPRYEPLRTLEVIEKDIPNLKVDILRLFKEVTV